MSGTQKLGMGLALALLVGVIIFSMNRGYGKVSPGAYESAKALYGACLAKSPERLDLVEQLLKGESDQSVELNARERQWLFDIIATARQSDWESAASSARQIMEDQVER